MGRLNIALPDDLHQRLRLASVISQQTIKELVLDELAAKTKTYVQKNKTIKRLLSHETS
ncbi:MAG: hypothetical protein H6502_01900 [Candidatus Woesearchaeota archaeon]|nr:MAG: hypothetical protein H6502_01900 [Candidatus Woesearchaeota archaeon]